ncbi:hypothetical protein ACHAXS_001393 [Conticribra weissflogii]
MQDQSAASTVEAKQNFEHFCGTRNVDVEHYHANNGLFADSDLTQEIKKNMQRLTFCGVNAHHQNGITERMIKSLTLISRTLLLHAQRHWPEYITTMLWPLALKAAQDRLNQLSVDLSGRTPDSAPKWEPRARLGIYVSRSPHHAGNVALVLNPTTGLVSPQFHVVFDDEFTTVPHLWKGTVPPNWAKLVKFSSEKTTTEFVDLSKTWFQGIPDESAGELIDNHPTQMNNRVPTPSENKGVLPIASSNEGELIITPSNEGGIQDIPSNHEQHSNLPIISQSQDDEGEDNLTMPSIINLETVGLRRSPRIAAENDKKKNNMSFTSIFTKMCAFGSILATSFEPTSVFSHGQASVNAIINKMEIVNANFNGTLNSMHHMIFAAGKENNKCYTYPEMLRQDDAKDFIQAMRVETREHETCRHWDVVRKDQMPAGTKPIQAIWSFKQKRFPDGSLNKHKARLCAHGGMQQWGVNYWET